MCSNLYKLNSKTENYNADKTKIYYIELSYKERMTNYQQTKIYKIESYLGYMLIGTNKGVRVATVESDGSLSYGPLVIEESNGVYDFAFRDRFVTTEDNVVSPTLKVPLAIRRLKFLGSNVP